jgi:hypothetical protein
MLTKENILSVLREQKQLLSQKFGVREIAVFGSFARGEETETSDIDFLVRLETPLGSYISTKEALRRYLKKTFGRNIDLANPVSLKPHYKQRILKQAVYA